MTNRTARMPFAIVLLLSSALVLSQALDSSVLSSAIEHLVALGAVIPVKDIMVNAVGGFLGGLALLWIAVGRTGLRNFRARFSRPNVRLVRGRTPENIFSGLELGAPAAWIQQQLGVPTRVRDKWWGYRFSDALVSLTFGAADSLESISVALTDSNTTFEFPAVHFNCPALGKATVRDILKADHLSLEYRDSLRHSELIFTGREGPRGAWHYIALGALSPHIPGSLLPADFEWDKERERLVSEPGSVKLNWAAVSSRSDIDTFPWDFGLALLQAV